MVGAVEVVVVELGDRLAARHGQRRVEHRPQRAVRRDAHRGRRERQPVQPGPGNGVLEAVSVQAQHQLDPGVGLDLDGGDRVPQPVRATGGHQHRHPRQAGDLGATGRARLPGPGRL